MKKLVAMRRVKIAKASLPKAGKAPQRPLVAVEQGARAAKAQSILLVGEHVRGPARQLASAGHNQEHEFTAWELARRQRAEKSEGSGVQWKDSRHSPKQLPPNLKVLGAGAHFKSLPRQEFHEIRIQNLPLLQKMLAEGLEKPQNEKRIPPSAREERLRYGRTPRVRVLMKALLQMRLLLKNGGVLEIEHEEPLPARGQTKLSFTHSGEFEPRVALAGQKAEQDALERAVGELVKAGLFKVEAEGQLGASRTRGKALYRARLVKNG